MLWNEHNKIIIQEPKTISSQRIIALDVKTIKVIEQWRYNQKEWYFKFGYNTSKDTQFLFTNKFNELYYPQAPNDWLYNILEKYDLPKITLHGFRHSQATLLYELGVDPKDAQYRLRHANLKTTMDIYTHISKDRKRAPILKLDEFSANGATFGAMKSNESKKERQEH